ncbi:MAG: DUF3253 domain-containing protein [Polaromonas sp.]|nr:DUF3253 domain-containing protein [Polaromonas sp.]
MPPTDQQIRDAIAGLLDARQAGTTICPSEVARALAPDGWRPLMPRVRSVSVDMAGEGALSISQRGQVVTPGEPLRGPIRLGRAALETAGHPTTPDGRYFVVRGRLWRKANPDLPGAVRDALVRQLMDARRALRGKRPDDERSAAREEVDRVKQALGERGPVWWTDGAPDFNRKLAKNTPYRKWFERLPA